MVAAGRAAFSSSRIGATSALFGNVGFKAAKQGAFNTSKSAVRIGWSTRPIPRSSQYQAAFRVKLPGWPFNKGHIRLLGARIPR